MKARKCPAGRNCIAWSGTMKLNRICFSQIASRMIKGAAGRRWWSPVTEATSVTPSLIPEDCFVSLLLCLLPLTSGLLSCSLLLLYRTPAPSLEVTPRLKELERHSLGPWEFGPMYQILAFTVASAQCSAFPCSLILPFWVKIWPFSVAVTRCFLLT